MPRYCAWLTLPSGVHWVTLFVRSAQLLWGHWFDGQHNVVFTLDSQVSHDVGSSCWNNLVRRQPSGRCRACVRLIAFTLAPTLHPDPHPDAPIHS